MVENLIQLNLRLLEKSMSYKIIIYSEKQWCKDLKLINPNKQKLIFNALEKLETEPWPEGLQVKRLKNYPTADFRLRILRYRVLLDRDEDTKTICLYRILERGKLY